MLLSLLQSGFDKFVLIQLLLSLPIIVFALSVHETAHGWVAYKLGDSTAKNLGRLTLNPIKHLNLFGFLSMLILGIGWANPVPINPRNFKNPRKGMMLSSLAGPLSNLCIAVIATFLGSLTHFILALSIGNGSLTEGTFYVLYAIILFFYYAAYLNFSLAIFNLIPCPPFDGSRIFFYFLPKEWYFKVMRYERYLGLGILLLVLGLSRLGFSPVSYIADGLYSLVSGPFNKFFDLILNLVS